MRSQILNLVTSLIVLSVMSGFVKAIAMQEAASIGRVTATATLFDTESLKSLGYLPEGTRVEALSELTDRSRTKWLIVTTSKDGIATRGMILRSTVSLANENSAASSRGAALPAKSDEVFDLGMKVLRKMSLSNQNPTLSPYGLWANSRFLLSAARGETKTNLEAALGIHEQTAQATLSGPEFRSVDRILRRKEVGLSAKFEELISSSGAECSVSTFDDAARVNLNDWARKLSSGQVSEYYPEAKWNRDSVVLFANCVTLEARWKSPFRWNLSQVRDFTLKDETTVRAQMMSQLHPTKWFSDPKLAIDGVILPFEESELASGVLAPQAGTSLDTVIESLTAQSFSKCIADAQIEPVALTMPRIEAESSYSMIEMLNLSSFLPVNTDFSGMTAANVSLAEVYQTTALTLVEDGTNAAAVTRSEIVAAAPSQSEPKILVADRPFLVVILHLPTQCPVFMTRVDRPAEPNSRPEK